MGIWYLAIVMLLHHIVDRSQHLLGGAKSHWSLWHIAMLVEVNLMPGDGVPSHRCSTGDDLPEKRSEVHNYMELPEGVRMSRVENRIDLPHLHTELWLKCFSCWESVVTYIFNHISHLLPEYLWPASAG